MWGHNDATSTTTSFAVKNEWTKKRIMAPLINIYTLVGVWVFILLLSAEKAAIPCTAVSSSSSSSSSSSDIPSLYGEEELQNKNVDRVVYLTGRVVKTIVKATLLYSPKSSSSPPLRQFSLFFPKYEASQLGHIIVNDVSSKKLLQFQREGVWVRNTRSFKEKGCKWGRECEKSSRRELSSVSPPLQEKKEEEEEFLVYTVFLEGNVQLKNKGDELTYELTYYLGHAFKALPKQIKIKDHQFVVYKEFPVFFSPYPSTSVSTSYQLPVAGSLRGKDKLMHSHKLNEISDNKYSIEVLRNVPPSPSYFSSEWEEISLNFRLLRHLAYFESVERHIDVSHWGNVLFHEYYDLRNAAAELKGEFSRTEYSSFVGTIIGRIRRTDSWPESHIAFAFEGLLPKRASGLDYFDHIGNISSSSVSVGNSYISFTTEPRYPIVGGWQADWQLQYSVPIRSVMNVEKNSNSHLLSIPLSPPFLGIFSDKLITKVALPQGAHNVRLVAPRHIDAKWTESKWGWFDILEGRPMIVLQTNNLFVPSRNILQHKFHVIYDYTPSVSDIQKPLVICFLVFIPFLLFILCKRLSFRIVTPEEGKEMDRNDLRKSMQDHLRELYEDLTHITDDFMASIESYNSRPVRNRFDEAKKKWKTAMQSIATKLKNCTAEMPDDEITAKLPALFDSFVEAIEAFADASAYNGTPGGGRSEKQTVAVAEAKSNEAEREFLMAMQVTPK